MHLEMLIGGMVCRLVEAGVMGVIGPISAESEAVARGTCQQLRIPYFSRVSTAAVDGSTAFQLLPTSTDRWRAICDLIDAKKWRAFAYVFEDNEALLRLHELLRRSDRIFVQQTFNSSDTRKVLRTIARQSISNVILDVSLPTLRNFFKAAQIVGMLTDYHNYIVTNLDFHMLDPREFQSVLQCNVTGFDLLRTNSLLLNKSEENSLAQRTFKKFNVTQFKYRTSGKRIISHQSALIHDYVIMFAKALGVLSRTMHLGPTTGLTCRQIGSPWTIGLTLATQIKTISSVGLMGHLQFDTFGQRSNITVNIVQLKDHGVNSIGSWRPQEGVKFDVQAAALANDAWHSLRNKTLRITTIISPPYVMFKNKTSGLSTADHYQGFCVDLIRELAKFLKFTYELRLCRDGTHGYKDPIRGVWKGMIGEIVDREADLALGDITINAARKEVVDFSVPFLLSGVGIVHLKYSNHSPVNAHQLFAFFAPFSFEVWCCVGASIASVAVAYVVVVVLSPFEKIYKRVGKKKLEKRIVIFRYRLIDCIVSVLTCMLRQQLSILPRAPSTRILTASCWAFSFLIWTLYTCNLASFLISERLSNPIETVQDLADQTTVEYGFLRGGATEHFFRTTRIVPYQQMWHTIVERKDELLVSSLEEGVARVQSGQYAFFMETPTLEYVVRTQCNLAEIGWPIDQMGYALVAPLGSPYRAHLSQAILALHEKGTIAALKNKWFSNPSYSPKCSSSSGSSSGSLRISQLGGLFLLLLCGLLFAFFTLILEYVWKARSTTAKRKPHQRNDSKQSSNHSETMVPNLNPSVSLLVSPPGVKIDDSLDLSIPRHVEHDDIS